MSTKYISKHCKTVLKQAEDYKAYGNDELKLEAASPALQQALRSFVSKSLSEFQFRLNLGADRIFKDGTIPIQANRNEWKD